MCAGLPLVLTVTHFVQKIIDFVSGIRFEWYHLPMNHFMKTIGNYCKTNILLHVITLATKTVPEL